MPRGLQFIPDFLPWIALENIEKHLDDVENKDTPHAASNGNEHRQITFAGGIEDPGVLKKNGELDKDIDRIVDNDYDIDPLV